MVEIRANFSSDALDSSIRYSSYALDSDNRYTTSDTCQMIEFMINSIIYVWFGRNKIYFSSDALDSDNRYTTRDTCQMIEFMINGTSMYGLVEIRATLVVMHWIVIIGTLPVTLVR